MEALKMQQPEQTISQAREEINRSMAQFLNAEANNRAEAFRLLPVAIERWAEVVRSE